MCPRRGKKLRSNALLSPSESLPGPDRVPEHAGFFATGEALCSANARFPSVQLHPVSVADLPDHVRRVILENQLIPENAAVIVAASGGLDSMVLLNLLSQFAAEQHWKITVAHFNHLLRGTESDLDEALVASEANRLGLQFERGDGDVRAHANAEGISLEMAARALRHRFLVQVAARYSARHIALAHHADDQVETVLLRLLRGSGSEGFSGMRMVSSCEFDKSVLLVRPFLGVRRAVLEEYAKEQKIRFRQDSTNTAVDFTRNWVRHRLVPLLEKHVHPRICDAILRTAQLVSSEADFVTLVAQQWRASLEPKDFVVLHPALQRRIIQLQLRELGVPETYDLIEALRNTADAAVMAPGGLALYRDSSGFVRFKSEDNRTFNCATTKILLTDPVGETTFGKLQLWWEISPSNKHLGAMKRVPGREFFDADCVGSEVVLRYWRPGDRFRPIGMPKLTKLQDIFVNAKLPKAQRHQRVIAESPTRGIFWVEGLRIGEEFKIRPDTKRILEWRWKRTG